MNIQIKARGWWAGRPYEIDRTVELSAMTIERHESALELIELIRRLVDDAWRERAYVDGESSRDADWVMALADLLPDGVDATSGNVAAYIRAEQQRLR